MKKQWLLSFLLSFLFITASAEDGNKSRYLVKVVLSGKITDAKSGEPLPGASVFIADDKIGTIADANGNYIIRNIPDGHHIIEISHAGYATLVEHIELYADAEKNFSLSSIVVENQGVIISGVSGATSIRKTPVPVTSLRKKDLLQSASANIIDALGRVPGVTSVSTGPAISKPVIRGLGYNRVVVVNEGVRQEGQQWGDEHGIEIDELSVSRAEVLKGPASLMYGSDAIAGVIHLITHTPVADGVTQGNLLTNYQSTNDLLALHATVAGNKKGINWNFYSTFKSAGDYKNKYDGRVLNSRFNEKNFGGYLGVNKSWGYSHLIISRFDQHVGMVEGDRDDATGRFILYGGSALERVATTNDLQARKLFVPFQHIQHYKIISDNNFAIRKSRLKINLAFQNNIRKEYGDPESPDHEDLFFDLKTINYNLQWQLPELREWHTTVGVNGMQQANKNKGPEVIIPEYDLFDLGAFVFAQRLFRKSSVSGGFRFDHRSVDSKSFEASGVDKFTAFTRTFSNFSGSIGISYEPSDNVTLKFNIARGFRSPSLAELGSNGVHEGTDRYEYGDNQLRSENSLQPDLGIDLNYEHFSIGITAFYNRINDFIFYRKLESVFGGDSIVVVDGQDHTAFKFHQNDANLKGLELTLDIHPHPLDWLHFEHALSFVRGKFINAIDGSINLPLIPAMRLVNELRGDLNKAGRSFRNLYLKFEADNVFKQDKIFSGYNTETATPGYTLLNAGAGVTIINKKSNKPVVEIYLSGANLTNRSYQQHLSRLKYTEMNVMTGRIGVFNPGRNFSVKLNFPLRFNK